MKKTVIFLIATAFSATACEMLDTMVDSYTTQQNLDSEYNKVLEVGFASYGYIKNGLSELDDNIAAAKSDEAVQTSRSASVRLFNNGSWSAYTNPDNPYESLYKGIRAANYFLDYSRGYKRMLANGRDTISDGGTAYRRDVENAGYLRAEAHVVKAYYYFELLKRYGGVPLYKEVPADNTFLPRASYDDIVEYIVSEIDYALDSLAPDWKKNSSYDGRFNLGSALALKSRVLLYAASPLNTEGLNDDEIARRWGRAAQAAYSVIALNKFALSPSYSALFTGNTSANPEIILSRRSSPSNSLERANYPIATAGGNSGLTPSHNLVDAYEYTGPAVANDPYANRDPRLGYTVVTNNSTWNGRTIDIAEGGSDSYLTVNSSRTGYYLKKYLADELVLTQEQTAMHQWVYFRYAEILLNYAEAANEAWGPDDGSHVASGLTARQALDQVRGRADVRLDPADLTKYEGATDKERMRAAVKAERRVELAFEDHRYWDLLRWNDGTILGQPIEGVKAVANGGDGLFRYETFKVEDRVFDPKMYRYPIPYQEISKSKGVVTQNAGW